VECHLNFVHHVIAIMYIAKSADHAVCKEGFDANTTNTERCALTAHGIVLTSTC
jgi:hypothetical protein